MSLRSRVARWATATVAIALVAAGCAPAATETPGGTEPVAGGTVTVGLESEPAGQFNVHVSGADVAASTLRGIFDSLVSQSNDGEFHPWLARSWDISDDGLTYTFELRDDVTFTDGEPFNAEAVKANFDHVVAKDTASQYASSLIGGSAYDSTEVVDEYTVSIHLKRPFAPLLQGLSTTYLGMISPKVIETSKDQLAAGGPDITVGSGPYVLQSYVAGQEMVLVPNPDHTWGPEDADHTGAARPDRLVLRFLPEPSVRAGALTSGEVDIASNLSPNDAINLENDPAYQLQANENPGLPWSLFLNHDHGILTDAKVREALMRGIDIDSAVQTVYQGKYQRAWSILGPTTPNSYDASLEGTWPHDEDLANQLLDEAGWTERDSDGIRMKDGERLSLNWPTATAARDARAILADAFQADLKKVGVDLAREPLEVGAYLQALQGGDYDVIDWSFVRSDGDILRLHLFSGLAPIQNASWVNDPQVDEWVTQASESSDPAERAELYQKVQQWAIDDVAFIPVYVPTTLVAAANHIGGLTHDISGWPRYDQIWTTKQQ